MADWKEAYPHSLEQSIVQFKEALPGCWFSVGECQFSADASCGPTRESEDIALSEKDRRFDDGFHVDLPQPASVAEALMHVTREALLAKQSLTTPKQEIANDLEANILNYTA